MEYSPYSIEIEDPTLGLLNACRELGVAVVAYSPLSKGLVTGQLRGGADFEAKVDLRRVMPRFAAENLPTNLVLAELLQKIAGEKGCTPAQLDVGLVAGAGR